MLNTCAELFKSFIEAKGLACSAGVDNDGDSIIEFPFKGKATKLFFTGDNGTYLSLYLVYEKVPDEKLADVIFVCNELNNQYKWVTFYVDRDNDIILHDDAILSVENAADEAFELLARMIQISEEAKAKIMRAIYA